MSNNMFFKLKRLWQAAVLRLIPAWIKPNQITIFRLLLIPLVLYLLGIRLFIWSMLVFFLAAFLDIIDGALARGRNQSSTWGLILDPYADKLLTVLTILFLSIYYPDPLLPLLMIIADLMMLAAGGLTFIFLKNRAPQPANWLGKGKMVCGVLAIILMYFVLLTGLIWLTAVANLIIVITMILGFVSFTVYGINFVKQYVAGE